MAAMNMDDLEQQHTKIASRYDVYNKLAFPLSLMGHVWTEERRNARVLTFRVLNIYSQPWIFQGHMRWDAEGHPKPEVFGLGWTSFKETMGLKVGDELVFYRPPNGHGPDENAPVFIIGVKRQIRLGGATFSGHVTPKLKTYVNQIMSV